MKIAFAALLVTLFALQARATETATHSSTCRPPNHLSHSNEGPHPVVLHSDWVAQHMGHACTLAKIKAVNFGDLHWAQNDVICLPPECELGHSGSGAPSTSDRHALGNYTFKERLGAGRAGACKYLADLSSWANTNKVKAAMGGAAAHFVTIDGLCHFAAHSLSELKPEWHLDPHAITTACTGLAGVSLAGAHAAAHGVSVCTAAGALHAGAEHANHGGSEHGHAAHGE